MSKLQFHPLFDRVGKTPIIDIINHDNPLKNKIVECIHGWDITGTDVSGFPDLNPTKYLSNVEFELDDLTMNHLIEVLNWGAAPQENEMRSIPFGKTSLKVFRSENSSLTRNYIIQGYTTRKVLYQVVEYIQSLTN